MVFKIVFCIIGTLGFCAILNLPKDKIWIVLIGSLISSTIYETSTLSTFWATLLAATSVEIYSEIMARFFKTPAIVILLPSTIPLLPGSFLFHTMNAIISRDFNSAIKNGAEVVYVAFALAMSSVITLIGLEVIRRFTRK